MSMPWRGTLKSDTSPLMGALLWSLHGWACCYSCEETNSDFFTTRMKTDQRFLSVLFIFCQVNFLYLLIKKEINKNWCTLYLCLMKSQIQNTHGNFQWSIHKNVWKSPLAPSWDNTRRNGVTILQWGKSWSEIKKSESQIPQSQQSN